MFTPPATVPQGISVAVPHGLDRYRQFINWKLVPDPHGGKADKVPCDARGYKIDAHNPVNWMSAEEASASGHGIGFVFTENDPFFFIDLDHAWTPADGWSTLTTETLAQFPDAAIEVSHSGDGLHIIGTGTVGEHRSRVAGTAAELYTEGRFVALTGTDKRGRVDGTDYSAPLAAWISSHGLNEVAAAPMAGVVIGPDERDPLCTMSDSDPELLEIMRNSRGSINAVMGDKAHPWDLWTANADALGKMFPQEGRRFDHSAADSALLYHLGFYTGKHRSRMLRLFRQSALFRPGHYEGKYAYRLDRIFNSVIANVHSVYNKPRVPALPVLVQVMPDAVSGTDLLRLPVPAREWTVDQWIPHKQVTLFYADGGVGKTTMLLQLAVASKGDRLWLGKAVTPRRVLYVSGEDELDELHYRLNQICHAMLSTADHIIILPLETLTDPAMVKFDRGTMTKTQVFEHVQKLIVQHQIGLVIFDPAADLFDGDEIDRRQVRAFISSLRRLSIENNVTSVLAAHPSVEGMKSNRGSSGSTAWNNSARSRIYVQIGKGATDGTDSDYRTLTLAKSNRGKTGATIIVKWINGAFSVEGHTAGESSNDARMVFLKLLKLHNSTGIMVNGSGGRGYAPNVFAEHPDNEGITKAMFAKSMKELLRDGDIIVHSDGCKSRQRSNLWINSVIVPFPESTSSLPSFPLPP